MKLLKSIGLALSIITLPLMGDNQTATVSPVLPGASLPFSIELETASFTLPSGIQSFAAAVYDGKWIIFAGRTNGLHGFDFFVNNFPPNFQNTTVYIVDPTTGASSSRSLTDPDSGLTQEQVDALSVTASEFFQKGSIFYIVGGYGINTASGLMETKSTLTEIDLPKLVKWVNGGTAPLVKAIRQVSHPLLQVTGGGLFQNTDHNPFLLMVGQNFTGLYDPASNGAYTQQIRSFWLQDDGKNLYVVPHVSNKTLPDYRRRDLNITPTILDNLPGYAIFAGVFTLTGGVWTVPITVTPDGEGTEADPNDPDTFKQAMNQYNCAEFGLYSNRTNTMYVVLPGGLSYGYFSGGTFQTDDEVPFINQVTTIKMGKHGLVEQYLMDGEYPVILSTGSNPGNQLLFGAEALFVPAEGIALYRNGTIQLDKIKAPTVIGYIVGGIMSTLPNTNTMADSTSSPYVFTVRLVPNN